MNEYILGNVVEYIAGMKDMPFDAVDIQESLEEVLAHYGLYPELSGSERDKLKDALMRMVLKKELRRMIEVLDLGVTSGLERIGTKLYPGLFDDRRRRQASARQFRLAGSRGYDLT